MRALAAVMAGPLPVLVPSLRPEDGPAGIGRDQKPHGDQVPWWVRSVP